VNDLYTAGFDASWEIDIFGGVRRSVEAAVRTSTPPGGPAGCSCLSFGEVAMNYIDVRSYQARIGAAEGNVARQAETYQLTLWRQQAGLGDELAVQEALSNLESTRSQVPDLRSGLEAALNRIAVLLGEQPGKVHKELEKRHPFLPLLSMWPWACRRTCCAAAGHQAHGARTRRADGEGGGGNSGTVSEVHTHGIHRG
jgi:outer membrane protein TolC